MELLTLLYQTGQLESMLKSKITDVIGVDFTPGTRQEEISYMGKNTNLQV